MSVIQILSVLWNLPAWAQIRGLVSLHHRMTRHIWQCFDWIKSSGTLWLLLLLLQRTRFWLVGFLRPRLRLNPSNLFGGRRHSRRAGKSAKARTRLSSLCVTRRRWRSEHDRSLLIHSGSRYSRRRMGLQELSGRSSHWRIRRVSRWIEHHLTGSACSKVDISGLRTDQYSLRRDVTKLRRKVTLEGRSNGLQHGRV